MDENEIELPLAISMELKDLKDLLFHAEKCAEDLVAEIETRHPKTDDPIAHRRRERDLVEARWLLSNIPKLQIKYNTWYFG
jgi:hypothetical protein